MKQRKAEANNSAVGAWGQVSVRPGCVDRRRSHSVSARCWLRETLEQASTTESLLRSAQVECLPTCGASDWISPVLCFLVQIGNQCNHALLLAASVLRPSLAASAGAVHVAIRIAETSFACVFFNFTGIRTAECSCCFGVCTNGS